MQCLIHENQPNQVHQRNQRNHRSSVRHVFFTGRKIELQEMFVSDVMKELIAKQADKQKNQPQSTNSKANVDINKWLEENENDSV